MQRISSFLILTAIITTLSLGSACTRQTTDDTASNATSNAQIPKTKFLDAIPKELGEWTVVKIDNTDPGVMTILKVMESEGRTYVKDDGTEALYHASIYDHLDSIEAHSPLVAYPATGWDLISSSSKEITLPDNTIFSPTRAYFEKNGHKACIIFWYQYGDFAITNDQELKKAQEYYNLKEESYYTIKIMLQSTVNQTFSLHDLAAKIYEYTRDIKHQKTLSPENEKATK